MSGLGYQGISGAVGAQGDRGHQGAAGGGGGVALSGAGAGLLNYTTNPAWDFPTANAGVLYNISGAGLTLFSNGDGVGYPNAGPMLAFTSADLSPGDGSGPNPATGMTEPTAGMYLSARGLTIFNGDGIKNDLGGANTAVSVGNSVFHVGHGLGTSPGSFIDIGNSFAENMHTCVIYLPDVDAGHGPSSGEAGQVITSRGGDSEGGQGYTPQWKYISSDNWNSSGPTFDDDINNVVVDAGGSMYGDIQTEIDSYLVANYPGLTKSAIVPSVHGEYVALYCVEASEVRFEEIISIKTNGKIKIEHEIDPEFVFICEPDSIKAIGYTTTEPALCGVKVKEKKIIITFSGNISEEITVKLSGIRKGFANVRFEKKTEEQANHNNDFWGQAKI